MRACRPFVGSRQEKAEQKERAGSERKQNPRRDSPEPSHAIPHPQRQPDAALPMRGKFRLPLNLVKL